MVKPDGLGLDGAPGSVMEAPGEHGILSNENIVIGCAREGDLVGVWQGFQLPGVEYHLPVEKHHRELIDDHPG